MFVEVCLFVFVEMYICDEFVVWDIGVGSGSVLIEVV